MTDGPGIGKRPGARGEPDRLHERPSIPKPLALVRACDPSGSLRLVDRRLINVLLAFSWHRVLKGDGPYDIAAVRVREAMGQRTQHKNGEVRGALARLSSTPVTIMQGGVTRTVPLLESYDLPSGSTRLTWRFSAPTLEAARDPTPWSKVRLDVCARLRRKSSLILYELLAAYPARDVPRCTFAVDELKAALSLPPASYTDWADLWTRAVAPAVSDINELADFHVKAWPTKARGSRRVVSVTFKCTQPPSPARPG